jgi:hypothetical protein
MIVLEWLALCSIVRVYVESEAGFWWLNEVEDVASETYYMWCIAIQGLVSYDQSVMRLAPFPPLPTREGSIPSLC